MNVKLWIIAGEEPETAETGVEVNVVVGAEPLPEERGVRFVPAFVPVAARRTDGYGRWAFLRKMRVGDRVDLPPDVNPRPADSAMWHAAKRTGFVYARRAHSICRVN